MSAPFAIVTDGTCTPPGIPLKDLGVGVAPLHVRIGGDAYRAGAGGDLSNERFYELLRDGAQVATTSQPSPGDWSTLFDEARARGQRDVLVVTIAASMSGTFASASLAARDSDLNVIVVDSLTNSGGQGLIVRALSRAREAGCSFDDAVALARRLAGRPVIFAYVDTLEFLQRSGRVPALAAVFGALLRIKPLVRIADGETKPVGRARTRAQALERVKGLARASVAPAGAAAVGVVHTDEPAIAAELAAWARAAFSCPDVFCEEAGPVLATHVGPGVVAIALLEEDS